MMNKKIIKKLLFIFSFIFVLGKLCFADISQNSGTSEFVFLKMGVSARAISMGEAFVAVSDDVSALRYNPAGLRMIPRHQIMATHLEWFQGFRGEYVAYGQPIENGYSIGGSAFYLTVDDIERRNDSGVRTGNVNFQQMAAQVTLARGLGYNERMLVGGSLKYASELLDTETWDTLAFDAGVLFKVNQSVQIGAVLRNLSLSSAVLPTEFRYGASMVYKRLGLSADLYKYRDTAMKLCFGAEYIFKGLISFRAGYNNTGTVLEVTEGTFLDDIDVLSSSGISVGMGIGTKPLAVLNGSAIHFDYGFANYGKLGLSHIFSISTEF